MAVLITVLLVAVITGIYFRRQSGTDRFKKLVILNIIQSTVGLAWVFLLLMGREEIDMYDWHGELTDEGMEWMLNCYLSMVLGVGGIADCCFNLLKYIEEIKNMARALTYPVKPDEEEKKSDAETGKRAAGENSSVIENVVKMRIVNDGWKCICCGQANKNDEQQCVECGTKKYEPRTAVGDAKQAKIISEQVVCPVCGIMQGTFRNTCRNCGTKFDSAEAQQRYLRNKTWQCQSCEQENSGIMRYCAFCGAERDASR